MSLKVFTAGSMSAALALVKKDLGRDAVILHTRSYKRGGIFGWGAQTVVEITAADPATLGHRRRKPVARKPASPSQVALAREADPESRTPAPGAMSAGAGDLIRRTYAAARVQLPPNAPVVSVPLAPAAPVRPQPVVAALPTNEQLADEMRTVKRMVADLIRQQQERENNRTAAPAPTGHVADPHQNRFRNGEMPDALFDQYLNLLKQEVTEELAEEIVGQVRAALKPEQMGQPALVRQVLQEAIAKLIPIDVAAGRIVPASDGRPRTIALIGPTGVGKTTTVAKLAAIFKLKHKHQVGLITLDTYRIAAVDQLRTYANIIGVPLHVVSTTAELAEAQARCAAAKCDLVLIDTAGRSQRDDPKLEQLGAFIRAANPHEVHLVLSSTCTQSVLLDAVERFARIRADRIIFTKLDEAVSFGVLLNVIRKVNKRLSFVTTGQEVPHQIEPGQGRRLAALLLGERV